MLRITIDGDEFFDEETQTFSTVGDVHLELEHSLVSMSKWEAKYKVPFISSEKTADQVVDYIKFMVVTPNVPETVLEAMSPKNIREIQEYIESTETATTFTEMPSPPGKKEIVTSELVYYWMVAYQIPFECERWHLNRLFALIRICSIKQGGGDKKVSRHDTAQHYRALNAARRAKLGTKG